jgi:multicopper oxidase
MSVTQPISKIPRWSVVGMEGMFTKMWDPPTESPVTPDELLPTNPVPEVMAAAGMASAPVAPHTMQFDLLHSLAIPTWDGLKTLNFYTIISPDIPATLNGVYPGVTLRMPCGVVFHGATAGKGPPPHTIHWHGIEPTPMNDGVGHCSMELGKYTYQWQPSFIGTYFYHCHRNTMQHFEFGLFGLMIFEPADTYFATQVDPAIPIGHCRDGKRRTGANLQNFPQFPGWVGGLRTDPDPWAGNPNLKCDKLNPVAGNINPHAQTVPYDVEAIWVFDDRDSVWSDLAPGAHTGFPRHGSHPGYDDNFARNPGAQGFLAFNDYGADYWFVTGVPVPAHKGGIGTIPPGIVIPPELNSGISGSQVSIEAQVNQTILVRVLDAAYNNCKYTFPVDVVIIEWDGRPLGVPPYGFNDAYLVPAGEVIEVSVGRRFGALIRSATPVHSFAVCQFIDTRGANVNGFEVVTVTARIPININAVAGAVTGTMVINGGATVTNSTRATLTLASDTATQMQFSKDGGITFFPFEPFATTRVVTLTPPGDGLKTITVRFKDSAGNVSPLVSASITLNTTAPTGTIVINDGAAFTNKQTAKLALTGTDVGAPVAQMQFSKDGINYFAFEPFATTRTVTLTPGDGLKTIFVRFKDSAGNISAPVSDTITLDMTAPTGTMTAPAQVAAATATVTLSATDTGSGVTQMQFSKNGSSFFALEPFATTRTVSLSPGDNTLTVRFRDAAGNFSAPITKTIKRV